MDTTKQIKILAMLDLLLSITYIITNYIFEYQLHPLLQKYLLLEEEAEITTIETILIFVLLPILILHVASLVGLILSKPWSKNVFVYTSAAILLSVPLLGPYIDHGVPAAFDTLTTMVMGMLIALLIYTNSAINKTLKHETTQSGAS